MKINLVFLLLITLFCIYTSVGFISGESGAAFISGFFAGLVVVFAAIGLQEHSEHKEPVSR